jgi:hypothetical protein
VPSTTRPARRGADEHRDREPQLGGDRLLHGGGERVALPRRPKTAFPLCRHVSTDFVAEALQKLRRSAMRIF